MPARATRTAKDPDLDLRVSTRDFPLNLPTTRSGETPAFVRTSHSRPPCHLIRHHRNTDRKSGCRSAAIFVSINTIDASGKNCQPKTFRKCACSDIEKERSAAGARKRAGELFLPATCSITRAKAEGPMHAPGLRWKPPQDCGGVAVSLPTTASCSARTPRGPGSWGSSR